MMRRAPADGRATYASHPAASCGPDALPIMSTLYPAIGSDFGKCPRGGTLTRWPDGILAKVRVASQ